MTQFSRRPAAAFGTLLGAKWFYCATFFPGAFFAATFLAEGLVEPPKEPEGRAGGAKILAEEQEKAESSSEKK